MVTEADKCYDPENRDPSSVTVLSLSSQRLNKEAHGAQSVTQPRKQAPFENLGKVFLPKFNQQRLQQLCSVNLVITRQVEHSREVHKSLSVGKQPGEIKQTDLNLRLSLLRLFGTDVIREDRLDPLVDLLLRYKRVVGSHRHDRLHVRVP